MLNEVGQRKYVNSYERTNIAHNCLDLEPHHSLFCMVLIETGCRISEALNLRVCNIDIKNMSVTFECLKKRKKGIFRTIPVSKSLIRKIDRAFDLSSGKIEPEMKLWNFSRMTAYRQVMSAIRAANVQGPQAMPRGLRHGFAVAALEAEIPITLVQKWMGHADLSTTAIYTEVLGAEERRIASRMWRKHRTSRMESL